ncbi:MAG: four-carbon acid sugar kinase family protein [Candidatus Sulfopaludibacter sp.]|nr:four-carbon acid sugar kinase family protein [Candidatus Sulfopaludibacter sp.]
MAREWLVIADDLTGACDAGVQFARCGLATSVMLARDAAPAGARVVAVNTESRHMDEDAAEAAVAAVADWITARAVFKKIDSVLRGNPGAEIAAAMRAFGCEAAVATPAFPAMGRAVNAGNGGEVFRSLRSDLHAAPGAVAEALAAGARVISADAECDADLDAIVSGGMASGRRILWAGSGGLAGALARRSESTGRQATKGDRLSRLVFCIGTDHAVTGAQVAELRRTRPSSVIVPLGAVPECGVLVLSGGDTAAAVCREAGARRIDLCDEILPGIPWGILRCGRFDGVPVVTKSGGFGAPDALLRVAEFFE